MVFAAGLIGSVASAFPLHQPDYSLLVLAAWFVLRTSPPVWHRWWLLSGVVSMQLVTLGVPIPQLLWDAAWLVMLLLSRSDSRPLRPPATSGTPLEIGHPEARQGLGRRTRSTGTSS